LKYIEERGYIEGRKYWGKSRALTNTNVCVECWRCEVVPDILSVSVDQVVREKLRDPVVKTSFGQD